MQTTAGSAVAISDPTRTWTIGRDLAAGAAEVAGRSCVFAEFVWVTFVAAQAADGAFTYAGMHLFGVGIEANPLIAFYASQYGAAAAILGAKAVAVLSALVLYQCGRHRTLGVLTIWYLLIAIWPWTFVLWP